MSLYVELPLDPGQRARITELVGDTQVWFAVPEAVSEDDRAAALRAEVIFGNCASGWIDGAERLRWLQLASVGIDDYFGLDWAGRHHQVVVTNLAGIFADPVAETCLAGVLALHRGIDRLVQLRETRSWDKLAVRPRLRLLSRARVLILGTGSIARRLRDLLAPFGCDLTMFGRTTGDVRTLADLDAVLPATDVLVGLLPGTAETAGLLDARRLGLLPEGAVIVNAGRGSLIDEGALVASLREGRLGGAVLDVTRQEPVPLDSPLWSAPNVVLTQHSAGGSADELDRVVDVFAENWSRFRSGQPLVNVVEWSRGY